MLGMHSDDVKLVIMRMHSDDYHQNDDHDDDEHDEGRGS